MFTFRIVNTGQLIALFLQSAPLSIFFLPRWVETVDFNQLSFPSLQPLLNFDSSFKENKDSAESISAFNIKVQRVEIQKYFVRVSKSAHTQGNSGYTCTESRIRSSCATSLLTGSLLTHVALGFHRKPGMSKSHLPNISQTVRNLFFAEEKVEDGVKMQ